MKDESHRGLNLQINAKSFFSLDILGMHTHRHTCSD